MISLTAAKFLDTMNRKNAGWAAERRFFIGLEFIVNGCVEVPKEMTGEEFYNEFIGFVESKGRYFGGTINEFKDEEG